MKRRRNEIALSALKERRFETAVVPWFGGFKPPLLVCLFSPIREIRVIRGSVCLGFGILCLELYHYAINETKEVPLCDRSFAAFPSQAVCSSSFSSCAAPASPRYFQGDITYRPVTTTADSGVGSLRDAIAASNDGDVIYFFGLDGQTST